MHAPPVAQLALALLAGVGWGIAGAPTWTAPLLAVLWLAAPVSTSAWRERASWLAVALVGIAMALAAEGGGCPTPTAGSHAEVPGRFLASPRTGSAPFAPDAGCGPYTVVTADSTVAAGVPVVVDGTWVAGTRAPWLRARSIRIADRDAPDVSLKWALVRWRDGLVARIERLYGARAPLVAALTLARREGMDRGLSETFARTGIAHLLAISGFHVGVITGGALALLRLGGVRRRRARLGAAGLAWAYVALIGFPDAASRAALILAMVALSQSGGRPPARWGALAAALVVLLAIDPAKLAGPGFQLSFLGAAGLVAWSGRTTRWIGRLSHGKCPDGLASALGAGIAATLATLPVVAWHFERVSVVGIPLTIVATPLVSLALPGAIVSLLLDPIAPWAASFLAGGVDALLAALEALTRWAAAWPWASVWTSRPSVVAGLVGCAIGWAIARHPRIRGVRRRALLGAYVGVAVVGWPLVAAVQGWGRLEVLVIDVGQGDAIALRSPRGRWMLVDAGPPARGPSPDTPADPGAHPAVRGLRARGVSRLEALWLTHADLDHIGGARAVLTSFTVGAVYDPALPAGKAEYVDVLEAAAARGVPWVPARAGLVLDFDGARVEVLSPADSLPPDVETNEASVVLRVSFGDFDALLTGDAYKATERELAAGLMGLELLKVGHHGSDTSTDSLLLALAAPELAVIPVGRFNRYGHPDPDVLARLEQARVEVRRTDLEGTLSVTARRDGSFVVQGERMPR